MLDFLFNIDVAIFKFFNQTVSNTVFDHVLPFITDLDNNIYFATGMLAFFVALYLFKFKTTAFTYLLYLIVALSLSDFIGGKVKKIAERPRPYQQVEINGAIKRSHAKENRSFYSNHSSNSFAVATYTASVIPGTGVFLIPIAAIVAYSRIYCGVHYPADVLVGGLVGIFLGLFFSGFAKKIVAIRHIRKKSQSDK